MDAIRVTILISISPLSFGLVFGLTPSTLRGHSLIPERPIRSRVKLACPIVVSTRAWYHVLKRAGIGDFRWHDLRTWAAGTCRAALPLFALQDLAGWETALR